MFQWQFTARQFTLQVARTGSKTLSAGHLVLLANATWKEEKRAKKLFVELSQGPMMADVPFQCKDTLGLSHETVKSLSVTRVTMEVNF